MGDQLSLKVSIIIPIYNGEKYIDNLCNQLKNQSFEDFEAIFINDGSIDNSLKLLNQYAENDDRFLVLDQSNHGICNGRNRGIKKSRGEYIVFLDQDDDFDDELIMAYYNAVKSTNADMAVFGTIRYYIKDGKIIKIIDNVYEEELVTDKNTMTEYLLNLDGKNRLSTIWNCIYKRKIIFENEILFDEYFMHGDEDGMFNIEYVSKCNSIYVSSRRHYSYCLRSDISTISKKNENVLNDYLHFIKKLDVAVPYSSNKQINGIKKLYMLRFFSNVYMRFCRSSPSFRERKNFIKKACRNDSFAKALTFSNKKKDTYVSEKYYFWNIFNFCSRHYMYLFSTILMDFLLSKKRKVATIQ